MWKFIRVSVLLLVFFTVSAEAYLQKVLSTSWEKPLNVVIYPVAADGSDFVEHYVANLNAIDFEDIERFLSREAAKYSQSVRQPVKVRLGARVDDIPPSFNDVSGPLENMWFSLRLRYWVERNDKEGSLGDIRLFVVYHNPETDPLLPHSVGLEKGLMGVVHAFADKEMEGSNNFVIAHEMLHTVGASDKYDPETNLPLFPIGYASPHKTKLYPQRKAELMGGRIPQSFRYATMPASLDDAIIGGTTAWEINWFK